MVLTLADRDLPLLPYIKIKLAFNENNCLTFKGEGIVEKCKQLRKYQPIALELCPGKILITAFTGFSSVNTGMTHDIQIEYKVYLRHIEIGLIDVEDDFNQALSEFSDAIIFYEDISNILASMQESVQAITSLETRSKQK